MTSHLLTNGGKTGHPPGLLQDDCRKLSKWLASRVNARQEAREVCRLIAQEQTMTDTIDTLRAQLAEAQRERDKAIDLLETMFYSYENGTACYEEPEDCSGFVGYAFKMEDLDFNACCDLLNRTRPRAAIDAAKGGSNA